MSHLHFILASLCDPGSKGILLSFQKFFWRLVILLVQILTSFLKDVSCALVQREQTEFLQKMRVYIAPYVVHLMCIWNKQSMNQKGIMLHKQTTENPLERPVAQGHISYQSNTLDVMFPV